MQWSAPRARALYIGIAGAIVVVSMGLWLADFALGAALAILLFPLAYLFARLTNTSPRQSLLLATHTNIVSAVVMTIFFSQSRGPWVGLASGLFLFVVLYALVRGARQVVFGAIGLAAVGIAFLIVFNLPHSPLEPLKNLPYVGRFGSIFDQNDPTGKVRELIWQGDVPLILPHAPLWSPISGDDPLNAIRPLVGYGPEAMYVAYNRYYPPDLAHYEARNASPDRSHNETFDSLVTTGLLGFLAYIFLYTSVVYLALKWIGAIATPAERNAFIALWLAGGIITVLAFGFLRGWYYAGVALPSGMIVGLFIFLVGIAVRRSRAGEIAIDPTRALWVGALLAAVIGHFIEINFGIAIGSTQLYFWFYAALFVVIGMNRLNEAAPAAVAAAPRPIVEESARPVARRRKNRRAPDASRKPTRGANSSPAPVLAWTAVVTLILITLGFEFFTNQTGATSALDAVSRSLFMKGNTVSYGVFLMFALTWVVAGVLGLDAPRDQALFPIGLFAVLSLTALIWYALLHTHFLVQSGDQTASLLGLIGLYYLAFFALVGALALGLWFDEGTPTAFEWTRAPLSALVAPVLLVAVTVAIYSTNYAGVAADILYKVGLTYDNAGAWDQSIAVYERALALQPSQDFYALFLGRAYLESARAATDPTKRDSLLNAGDAVLKKALQINPLNTDHSANLARLHHTWATLLTDPAQKADQLQKSIQYYQNALRLSPNSALLRDELAQTYFQDNEMSQAYAQLEDSLRLDQEYAPTFAYLGDYYVSQHNLTVAADNYLRAIALDPTSVMNPDNTLQTNVQTTLSMPDILPRAVLSYTAVISASPGSTAARLALANLYKSAGKLDLARSEIEQAVRLAPNDTLLNLTLVNFLSETGQIDAAVTAMRHVVDLATQSHSQDLSRFQDFATQLQNLQSLIQTAQKSPNDVTAQRNLAALWKARGQPQFALPVYMTITRLAPGDYDAEKNVALLSLQLNQLDQAQTAVVAAAALAPANEKAIWQNLQVAINAEKAKQLDQALSAAQAALALAGAADKPTLQAYVTTLQGNVTNGN